MLETRSLDLLREALAELDAGFDHLPATASPGDVSGATRDVLTEVARRMQDNYPYPHPLYAGQMLKPPHPVARAAYALAMWINPNNHALDGGRASSAMEKEAVAELARMVGWETHLGHLTGGGTMANLEALWVAGQLRPGAAVLVSEQAHYTHQRIGGVLGLEVETVPVDARLRMDPTALEERLRAGGVSTVVVTLGTTGAGAVDPLHRVRALADRYDARVHVDAAYGGYFALADGLDAGARAAFDALPEADSVVIDPHKHGLQPYGCGCVLFRDPAVGTVYRHDSPYTYFSSDALHLGEISLECSRPGAAAVALWATQRLLPLVRDGAFAHDLSRCHAAALDLYHRLEAHDRYRTLFRPELDIVLWAPRAETVTATSRAARAQFEAAAARDLHLALFALPSAAVRLYWPDLEVDAEAVTCLRSCLMKPEHAAWTGRIAAILDAVSDVQG